MDTPTPSHFIRASPFRTLDIQTINMKLALSLLLTAVFLTANGQVKSNNDIVLEINRELGGAYWSVIGDNIKVDNGGFSFGRGLWGMSKVSYELKYEFWGLQGEGQNTFVLYVKCKSGSDCILDPENLEAKPYTSLLKIPIHDDEQRATRVLTLLLRLK